nr:hypothetical protein [uncultured Prevotella sp.]
MKKRLTTMKSLLPVISATIILSSCAMHKMMTDKPIQIEYLEAHNYFCINNVSKPIVKKITSQKAFTREFGPAAFMGKRGEVTNIDFNKTFIIAYLLPQTNREIVLKPLSLILQKNYLELHYMSEQGDEKNFSTQPLLIIIVNKKYKNYIIKLQKHNK